MSHATLTVFHDGQFWVAVYEIHDEATVRAARHVFGPEPTGAELTHWAAGPGFTALADIAASSPAVSETERTATRSPNPKRARKLATRAQRETGIGTAAQRAIAESVSERVSENKAARKRRLADEARHRRQSARQRARSRHRGR